MRSSSAPVTPSILPPTPACLASARKKQGTDADQRIVYAPKGDQQSADRDQDGVEEVEDIRAGNVCVGSAGGELNLVTLALSAPHTRFSFRQSLHDVHARADP
jgi:hypothetical protein